MDIKKIISVIRDRVYLVPASFFVVSMILIVIVSIVVYDDNIRDSRIQGLQSVSIIRSNIESALNARLLLGRGIVSYIAVNRGIDDAEFQRFSENLIGGDPMVRNFSVLKGTTVIYVNPYKENMNVIGVNLAEIPAQRDAILSVIRTRKPLVVASVKLVQGGVGTVCRLPVFLGEDGGEYWGQVGLVLRQDVLLREAGIFPGSGGYDYALYEKTGAGTVRNYLFGSPEIFSREPVVSEVTFPFGSWELAAAPVNGWGGNIGFLWLNIAVGLIVVSFISVLIHFGMRSRRIIGQLEGLLPMCSNCKKVQNDAGEWDPVESLFIAEKSKVKITHSLCPECAQKLYGNKAWYKKGR